MKALKISLVLGLILAVGTYFNNSIAQTFGDSSNQTSTQISPRLNLVRNLLLKEVTDNPAFSQDREALQYALKDASENDTIQFKEIFKKCIKIIFIFFS